MNKKYQVFVSSTYQDLEYERREVIQGLLEIECIPIAMELFPAANDDQWTYIERLIDDCDYYVVIVGGRYGSLTLEGISYTRKEYEYAINKGIPVVGFIPKDPGKISTDKSERDPEKEKKLDDFKAHVQKKLCKTYSNPDDLRANVITSVMRLIRSDPRPGWIKANVRSEEAMQEILSLREKIDVLEKQLSSANVQAPEGTGRLQQGEDEFVVGCEYSVAIGEDFLGLDMPKEELRMALTWDQIFYTVSPYLIAEASERKVKDSLEEFLTEQARLIYRRDHPTTTNFTIDSLKINEDHFQTIKIQLVALGLIEKSIRERGINDTGAYWKLTNYGENLMMRLRAIQKEDISLKTITS